MIRFVSSPMSLRRRRAESRGVTLILVLVLTVLLGAVLALFTQQHLRQLKLGKQGKDRLEARAENTLWRPAP